MKYLVTGGAGFISSHLVDRLIKEGYEVVVVDNLSTGKKENLNPRAKFYKADICDFKISHIFKKEKPKIVFHFGAHIEARESVKDPICDAKINILGSLNILENCKKFNIKKIIFASSGGEIYGNAEIIPTSESYFPFPISPYGVAKFAVEKYLEAYFKMFKIPYLALRYGNVYGPRQNPEGEAGVIAIFTNRMLKNQTVLIHGSGRQTKDYIFINDAINATLLAFKKNIQGILNIGTGRETSVLEIYHKLKKLTHSKSKKRHIPLPPIGFKRGCLSIEKAKKLLSWKPKYTLDEGLKKTVEWFKNENINY
ncbi:MAG: NAD-dependent epimerase/dehydratase family protein [Minisyncoccales bacterium]